MRNHPQQQPQLIHVFNKITNVQYIDHIMLWYPLWPNADWRFPDDWWYGRINSLFDIIYLYTMQYYRDLNVLQQH